VAALGECVDVCVGASLNCVLTVGQQTIQPHISLSACSYCHLSQGSHEAIA